MNNLHKNIQLTSRLNCHPTRIRSIHLGCALNRQNSDVSVPPHLIEVGIKDRTRARGNTLIKKKIKIIWERSVSLNTGFPIAQGNRFVSIIPSPFGIAYRENHGRISPTIAESCLCRLMIKLLIHHLSLWFALCPRYPEQPGHSLSRASRIAHAFFDHLGHCRLQHCAGRFPNRLHQSALLLLRHMSRQQTRLNQLPDIIHIELDRNSVEDGGKPTVVFQQIKTTCVNLALQWKTGCPNHFYQTVLFKIHHVVSHDICIRILRFIKSSFFLIELNTKSCVVKLLHNCWVRITASHCREHPVLKYAV